jgi:Tfp pilus assembly protein PilV
MKIKLSAIRDFPRHRRAFTLVEVMIAAAITLVMFISFYAAMAAGVQTIQTARENLRATQIIVNRLDGIRLFTWDQLTDTTKFPTSFTENYYPNGLNGTTNCGIPYTGTVTITTPTLMSGYNANMYQITVQLSWISPYNNVQHTRQMSTYYARYGIQNYVFNSN